MNRAAWMFHAGLMIAPVSDGNGRVKEKTMFRKLAILMTLGIIAAATVGSAAALGPITAASLASGNAPVTACDTDGVSTAYTTQVQDGDGEGARFEVTAVDIKNLAQECAGKFALVSIQADGAHTVFGLSGADCATGAPTGGGQISGGNVTVELCDHIDAEDVDGISILIKDTPS